LNKTPGVDPEWDLFVEGGEPGYTGSQGNIGYTGSKGDQGNIGYTGSRGNTG